MADAFLSTCAGATALIPKAQIEAEACEAHQAGRSANEACPYPFHSQCGLHWLAIYNLCIPLPHAPQNTSQR